MHKLPTVFVWEKKSIFSSFWIHDCMTQLLLDHVNSLLQAPVGFVTLTHNTPHITWGLPPLPVPYHPVTFTE